MQDQYKENSVTSSSPAPVYWGERRYYALDYYLKETYHEKIYKLSLNGGCTCPNRDGTCGTRGCIFCSEGGSGDFAPQAILSIKEQLSFGKSQVSRKYHGNSYIAYFQAFTNTYAPISHLRSIFTEALADPEVKILSIATRPDCLSSEVLSLLDELNQQKPVWIELGLQTIHPASARFIRRGYELPVFEDAVKRLRERNIMVIVHVILFLPDESESDMLKTIEYLNTQPIQGIKLQLLHILENTDLAAIYRKTPFPVPDMDTYFRILGLCVCHLRPDIVIHRLTGDGPKALLIAPLWTGNKRSVLNALQKYFREENIWQGKDYTIF